MTHPVVNLNGTSKESLEFQAQTVLDAISVLQSCHRLAAPHGRDYQTVPPDAYRAAREEHEYQERQLAILSAYWMDRLANLEQQD